MKEELGDEWTRPNLFRIGASSLLGDIERQLFHYVTGRLVVGYRGRGVYKYMLFASWEVRIAKHCDRGR